MKVKGRICVKLDESLHSKSLLLYVTFKMPKSIIKTRLSKVLLLDRSVGELNFLKKCEELTQDKIMKEAELLIIDYLEDYFENSPEHIQRKRILKLIKEVNKQKLEVEVEYDPSNQ